MIFAIGNRTWSYTPVSIDTRETENFDSRYQGSIIRRLLEFRADSSLYRSIVSAWLPLCYWLHFCYSFASSLGENTITEESAGNVLFTRTRHGSDRVVEANKCLFLLRRVLSNRKDNRLPLGYRQIISPEIILNIIRGLEIGKARKVESWTKAAVPFQRRQNWSGKFFRIFFAKHLRSPVMVITIFKPDRTSYLSVPVHSGFPRVLHRFEARDSSRAFSQLQERGVRASRIDHRLDRETIYLSFANPLDSPLFRNSMSTFR